MTRVIYEGDMRARLSQNGGVLFWRSDANSILDKCDVVGVCVCVWVWLETGVDNI